MRQHAPPEHQVRFERFISRWARSDLVIDLVVAPWVRGSDSGLFFLEMMALPGIGVAALAVRAPAKIRRVIAAHGG